MRGDTINFATGVTILSDATGGQEEQDCLFYVNYHTAFLKSEPKQYSRIKHLTV